MAQKIPPDASNEDVRTVVKPDIGSILPNVAGVWNDESLIKIRTRGHVQPSVPDLRMVVRIQRKNKHPHSTKKHK